MCHHAVLCEELGGGEAHGGVEGSGGGQVGHGVVRVGGVVNVQETLEQRY